MKHILTLAFALLLGQTAFAQAGDDRLKELKGMNKTVDSLRWNKGGGIGFDLTGMGITNPRLGAGANRFGFGGLVNLFANQKLAKSYWDNNASLQLSAIRLGGKSQPFQKNVDILRLNSRYGYNIKKDILYFAIDALAETQLLATYTDNLLKKGTGGELLSKFLAPARLQLSPGIDYKPTPHLSFFVSPASLNLIYVSDDVLARIPENPETPPLGNESGKNSRVQLGYALKAAYNNKYFNDRISFLSKVSWFADYRSNLNGNVLWQNAMDIAIFKGLSLNLYGDMLYD
ncbi:MAG TPA: DUF3078 domain-containing protein, partial [Saprospiraceae bacterium]|nr:DUF3078 domain-containing protein [Saprospiraceae bacterium]